MRPAKPAAPHAAAARGQVLVVSPPDESQEMDRNTRLSLEAAGITLIGVIVSIGLTVAFGLKTQLWARVLAGAATSAVLVLLVKVGSSEGAALRRAANWITRAGPDR